MLVLEQEILTLTQWIQANWLQFLGAAVGLAFLGVLLGFLMASVRHGPHGAVGLTLNTLQTGFDELFQMSLRRLGAMGRLAFQEATRRRGPLVILIVFFVILMFAGWFLDRPIDHPAHLNLSAVLITTNFLAILLVIILSCLSLPMDIQHRTIYTVITKPVRVWEMVVGRILGITAVGTVVLAIMGLCSYIFVVRMLSHGHGIDDGAALSSAAPNTAETAATTAANPPAGTPASPVGPSTRTTRNYHHRHQVVRDEGGTKLLGTDTQMDHFHHIDETSGQTKILSPQGYLEARVPIGATELRFLGRDGKPSDKGVNVGNEWSYRSYIEGGTLAAAIFTFDGVTPDRFPQELPLELSVRVFRTYKGKIEEGIRGSIEIVNPDPDVPEARRARSAPFVFTAHEFSAFSHPIPRKLKGTRPDGTVENIDLFDDLVHNGQVQVRIRCEDKAQYFGFARPDVYLRAADHSFALSFGKGIVTIWCQLFIVTCFGVMFSTFLNGPVAMLATVAAIIMGRHSSFVRDVQTGTFEGGGPVESIVRITKQMNVVVDLELGRTTYVVQGVDAVLMGIMRAVSSVLPDFSKLASANFVTSGFDVPADLVVQHLLIAIGYFVILSCIAYFFLRTREIAA